MKKIVSILLSFILVLSGCGASYEEWQIPLKGIQKVTVVDYNHNEIELNETDYLKIIKAYNDISNISLNENFTDEAVFGNDIYDINITYNDKKIQIGLSELGFVHKWDFESEFSTYYDIDIYEEFHDVFRETIVANGMELIDYRGFVIENSYLQLVFSKNKDYVISGGMSVAELYDMLEIKHEFDDTSTINDYLLTYTNNPKLNDMVNIDNLEFKIINVKDGEILSVYLRVK